MRIFLYSISIFMIQILGRFNIWLYPYKARWTRGERLCYCEYEDGGEGIGMVSHISCCDCGASHYFWKLDNSFEFSIPRAALVPMATCLLDMASDRELEGCSHHAWGKWYARVQEHGQNKMVLSLPTKESLFDGDER